MRPLDTTSDISWRIVSCSLINLSNGFNKMNQDFMNKLSLWIYKTKVGTQKIDGSKLLIFNIIIALFSMEDKEEISHFLEDMFL